MEQTDGEMQSVTSDLRWYFNREETGPLRSNFGGMVYRLQMGRSRTDSPPADLDDERLDEAARAGGVARVLRALDPKSSEVLWRSFGWDWPDELGLLGDLSALAPITRAAKKAHQEAGSTQPVAEWVGVFLEQANKGRDVRLLDRIQRDARRLRSRALAAYLTLRRRIGAHV